MIIQNMIPCSAIRAVDNRRVVCCGGDFFQFELDLFETVALSCADEFSGARGGLDGCYGEALFVVFLDYFVDLGEGILAEFRES